MSMRYWPLSVIVTSPLVPEAHLYEISQARTRLPSEKGFYAMMEVARRTPAVAAPNLVFIETIEPDGSRRGEARRVFTHYPEADEWLRLERQCVHETSEGFLFVFFDGLH